jgi:hypothetical protein
MRCDVLVVGAGVAGISAAVRAARAGAQTVLIEKNSGPGGVAAGGMHRFMCGLYGSGDDFPKTTLNGGIAAEVCARLRELAPERHVQRMGHVYVLPIDSRNLVTALRSISEEESKLELLYDTHAVAAATEQDAIVSVAAEGPSGRFDVFPSAVIDCAGNAAVMRMSGVQCEVTPPDLRQLGAFAFRVTGLHGFDEMLPVRVPYCLSKAVRAGELPAHLKFTTYTPGDGPDEGYCRLNILQAEGDRSEQAREDALRVHRHLSSTLAAFKDSRIAGMSPQVVCREGTRVCGEYTLTAEDVLGGRKFSDGVVKSAWPIELWHPENGPSYQYLRPGDYYEIPARCLKVRDISNSWCAGRCISATREALGSTRVMGACISLGEEAGREAAHSI